MYLPRSHREFPAHKLDWQKKAAQWRAKSVFARFLI